MGGMCGCRRTHGFLMGYHHEKKSKLSRLPAKNRFSARAASLKIILRDSLVHCPPDHGSGRIFGISGIEKCYFSSSGMTRRRSLFIKQRTHEMYYISALKRRKILPLTCAESSYSPSITVWSCPRKIRDLRREMVSALGLRY